VDQLAKAEKANREMYAFGLQMIEQVRSRTPADAFMQSSPVVGFGQVMVENQAGELRDRLEALMLVPAAQ
jgi:hypothetical protein